MLWFFLWRSENKERKKLYDCENCLKHQDTFFDHRICFHPRFGEETYPFYLPKLNESKKLQQGYDFITMSEEEFFIWLDEFNEDYNPDLPPFELIQRMVNPMNRQLNSKEICLNALVDPEIAILIELEDACNNYHVLPYAGGLLDQPIILMNLFNVIRQTKNLYQITREESRIKAMNKKGGRSE